MLGAVSSFLVVGGNGFLGSHLVDELAARGHTVTVFDRFSAGVIRYRAAGVAQIIGDYLNRADISAALAGQEYVFHLVSTTSPATAEDDPTLDLRTNIPASIDLFSLAAQRRVRRVLFASTGGAIYGDQRAELMDESMSPRPVSPYAIGKLAIEGYLRYFRRKAGLESVVFRVSNPYGPRQSAAKRQGVISIFLNELAAGRPLTVFGDGSMERDFIAVTDAVRMMADVAEGEPRHDLYNIGSGRGATVASLVETIRSVTALDVAVEHRPTPATFIDRVVLDTSRFRSEFGERDLVDLAEGIGAMWADVRDGAS